MHRWTPGAPPKCSRFVEKPDPGNHATHYLESGNFLWNSGMFCFTTAAVIAELQLHALQLLEQTRACMACRPRRNRWLPATGIVGGAVR